MFSNKADAIYYCISPGFLHSFSDY